ncbi:peptidoglycan DD-metalloendopeptidase family protein [Dyella choica]|uniref:LysM peptidoglycan-binding domain-containing protein n=1 Tax=Dyella choica TaxID=1927959 RepID=A0A3S0RIL5_9GAMM|nr:peptidoglycan DD-metalloendopeptidase family protein [Dyella choica]RUL72245.1 LysM peptidoglycan-binding domain-containing protein [Dyella choica]
MKTLGDLAMLARMNGLTRWSAFAVIALALTGCSTVVVQPPPSASGSARPLPSAAQAGTYTVVKGDTLYSIAFRNGADFRDVAKLNGIASPYTIWPGQVLKLPGHGAAPAAAHVPSPVVAKAPAPATAAPVFQPVETKSATATPPAHASSVATAPAVAAHPLPPPNAAPAPSGNTVAANPTPATAAAAAPVVAASSGGTRVAGGVKWRWPASGQVVGRFQASAAIPGIDVAGKQGDSIVAAADGTVVYSGNGLVGYGELIIIKHNDSFLSAYGHNRKRLVTEGQQVKAGQQIAEMGSSGSTRDELQFQIRKDGNPVDPLEYLPSR